MAINPVHMTLADKLSRANRSRLQREWAKAFQRLDSDSDGAVTAARTLLESTCKHILEMTGTAHERAWDLPRLYSEASKVLGISAAGEVGALYRKFFGAAHTVVQSVSELRNKAGDAHGKGARAALPSRADAELAVNLAGSITVYLLSALDSHVAATKRLNPKGEAILKFDKTTVWRLVDHAAHSPEQFPSMSQEVPKPALLFVGDAGVYLMSNGKPALLHDGSLLNEDAPQQGPRLTAHAEGCDLMYEVDHWWPIHNAIEGGDDFCHAIELIHFRRALEASRSHIVVVAGRGAVSIYSDIEFYELDGVLQAVPIDN